MLTTATPVSRIQCVDMQAAQKLRPDVALDIAGLLRPQVPVISACAHQRHKTELNGLASTVNARHCDVLRLVAAPLRKKQIDGNACGRTGIEMYGCQCGVRVNRKGIITTQNAKVSGSVMAAGAHAVNDTVSDDIVKSNEQFARTVVHREH